MALTYNPLLFSGLQFSGGGSSAPTIGGVVVGADPNSVLIVDSAGTLQDVPLTNGQIVIGRTGNSPVSGSISGTSNQVIVTLGSGTIGLSLPQDIATTSSPVFANLSLSPSGSIDITSGGTLAIGTGNADIINIGNSGATINMIGDTIYQNVTDLNVEDKNITVNYGGSVGSASNSGIGVEEGGVITAYIDTTSDRNGWELKAPAQVGIVTISPGSLGFVINQGSHDPLTLGSFGSSPNTKGASLSGQVLTLQPADLTNPGLLTAVTQIIGGVKTFNDTVNVKTNISNGVNDISVDMVNAILFDSNAFKSVDWESRSLSDQDGVDQLQWSQTGVTLPTVTPSLPLKLDGGHNIISEAIALDSAEVSGILPYTNGGLGINTFDGANRVFGINSTNDGVETKEISGFNGITVSNGSNAIDISLTGYSPGDIPSTTFSGLTNNTSNQTITGFVFSNTIKSFEALVNVFVDATTDTYTTFKIVGTRNSTNWAGAALQVDYSGSVANVTFTINSSGQVLATTGSITGFTSGTITFRAQTV